VCNTFYYDIMTEINTVIKLLSRGEHQKFIKYLSLRNKRNDSKNIDLFKALANGNAMAIKNQIGSNAYNVLKKRLTDRLIDFMAQISFETEATSEIQIIKKLIVARKLFDYEHYKMAFKLLKNAETKAISISHYSLLNEIYHLLIQNSYHALSPDQNLIFERFEKNKTAFLTEERLNMVYAIVRKSFQGIEYRSEAIDLKKILEENYSKFGIPKAYGYSFKTLFQLAEIADIQGAYGKSYHEVNLFFIDQINAVKNGPMDNEKHLIYHINLLYLIANIYFRKKMFQTSLSYLSDMLVQMQLYNNRFYNTVLVKYVTLLALNLNFTNQPQKAANLLDDLLSNKTYNIKDLLNPYLVRIMIYFQQNDLENAKRLLAQLQHSDQWYEKRMGLEWLLNKKYIEILLHIELGNVDYVDSRIKNLERQHITYFKSKSFQILPFLDLVKSYYHQPDIVSNEAFKAKVKQTIDFKSIEIEDIFLLSFYAWLKSKMVRQAVYPVTIELVKNTA